MNELQNLETQVINATVLNNETAQWYLITPSKRVYDAYLDYSQIGLALVKFSGENHERLDLQLFKESSQWVCGVTLGKNSTLNAKDCIFQTQMALQIPPERLKFFHLIAPGAVNIKGCMQDIDMGNCEKVLKVLQENDKGFSINPNKITTLNFYQQNIQIVQPTPQDKGAERSESYEMQKTILNRLTGNFLQHEHMWYYYEKPIWCVCSEEFVKDSLRNLYMELNNAQYIDYRILDNLFKNLEANCVYGLDFNPSNIVGFKNGCLDLKTLKFEKSPGPFDDDDEFFKHLYIKDYLPYAYKEFKPKGASALPISSVDVLETHIKENMPTIYEANIEFLH